MNAFSQYVPILMGAAPTDGGGAGGGQLFTTFITFGLVILIFYFLIIRPQSKKQKETKRMLAEIKKGDRVATIGGIRGTVVSVKDDVVVLKVDTNTKLELGKSAVSSVLQNEEAKRTSKRKAEPAGATEEETATEDIADDASESTDE